MKKGMLCVVYVDDTIFAGPDANEIEKMIASLHDDHDNTKHKFHLESEGEVQDFLGINIKKIEGNTYQLTQTGLTKKVLEYTGMDSAHAISTPADIKTLGTDKDGPVFNEQWDYASAVGMLMYLATNSRPDIAFAVNQCARFTHTPRASHAKAVKRICRYLVGTTTQGLVFTLTKDLTVDCYVDADFAGLWGQEDEQDPISVKSRSGYLLTFAGCPLLWGSKLQTEVTLSTMEAEYVALSQSMRELIPIREVILEIQRIVFNNEKQLGCRSHSKVFEESGEDKPDKTPTHEWSVVAGRKGRRHGKLPKIPKSTVYEDNNACLKHAMAPKMSPRTKHIAVKYHFFREKVRNLEIEVVRIDTGNQIADIFTKGLNEILFCRLRKKLMGW